MFNDRSAHTGEMVLLVDDEESIRKLIRLILESMGYKVLDACNGKEGLALCRTHEGQIDILITDVAMPELGGRELAAAAVRLRPKLTVLFISGYSQEIVFEDRAQTGTSFLQKPFTSQALEQKVRAALCSTAAA
jgi:CheY-like chemotaxis protein